MWSHIRQMIGLRPEPRGLFSPDPKLHATAVRYAAKVLDEVFPGWVKRIDFKTMDMVSRNNCALAQASGRDYRTARQIVATSPMEVDMCTFSHAVDHPTFGDWRGQRMAWENEVKRRRAQEEVTVS